MVSITLQDYEKDLVVKSLQYCLETCEQGGDSSGCTDCEKVQGILNKIM